jgi:hypothetical protein
MNISANKDSGQPYMVYPVYETMESNASDFKYYVRYLRIPEEAIPENTLVRG